MGGVEARERCGSRQGRTPRVRDPAGPRQPGACVQTSVPSGRRTVGRRALAHFSGRAVFDLAALLLPLNLGALVWLGEASLLTVRGGARLGIPLLQAGLVALLQRPELAGLAASLERPLVTTNLGAWTALPQLALAAFGAALCLILARFLTDRRPFSAGAAWALVASFLALDGASVNGLATLCV